jgi:hypothetical protein
VELLMPAKSQKQERFMQAVANNPKFAKKVGVPQSVGKEFTMKKYQAGGMMGKSKRPKARPDGLKMMPGDEMPSNRATIPDAINPKRSARPKARPKYMEEEAGAVARGRRSYEREMEDMPMNGMKKGGKVRGCGMARGGAVRQCKMVKMKGS